MTATTVVSPPELLLGVDEVSQPDPRKASMRVAMTVDARHAGASGGTAVGALGVMVDEALGYSIIASLPPRSWTVSTEIWLDVVGPIPQSGPLVAEAAATRPGSYAVGAVRDGAGRVVVECRERGRQIDDPPDFEAPVQIYDVGPAVAAAVAGGGLAGLLGLVLGEEVSTLVVGPGLENPRRMMHGGVSLAAAEVVAADSRLRAGSVLPTSSVHVVHTRAAAHGATVELRAHTVHAGRSLWINDVTGTVDGRPVVVARVSAQ